MNTANHRVSRRKALKGVGVGAGMLLGSPTLRSLGAKKPVSAKGPRRPNIVYIFTDQQSARMMSCAGNKWLKTPAVDYLAKNGTRFERAYTTNPKCVPARVGMITGWFPGEFGVVRSGASFRDVDGRTGYARTNIGAQLKRAGYDLAYGGKVHLPTELEPEALGFEVISTDRKIDLANECAKYVKRSHSKPYYLVASFINPHDICYFYRKDLKPNKTILHLLKAVGDDPASFVKNNCPPLPPNFEPQKDEPEAYRTLMKKSKGKVRESFTEEEWRIGRWLYCRLTESVDAEIQIVLDAIRESGQEKNTVVIFSSDHGENDATYRLHGKETFNEESVRIPFIVMDKGGARERGRVDKTHLVSNGLDLLPTVLDYAGVPDAKGDPRGLSVRPLVGGKDVPWREHLGVESWIGRMVVGKRYKYIRYDKAGNEERLRDMRDDPHEKTHCTADPGRKTVLEKMRQELDEWFPAESRGEPVRMGTRKKQKKSKKKQQKSD